MLYYLNKELKHYKKNFNLFLVFKKLPEKQIFIFGFVGSKKEVSSRQFFNNNNQKTNPVLNKP
jgi:hypothetical protein